MTSTREHVSDFLPQKKHNQESEETELDLKKLLAEAGFSEKVVVDIWRLYGNSDTSTNQSKKSRK